MAGVAVALLMTSFLLASCGGGGDSNQTPATASASTLSFPFKSADTATVLRGSSTNYSVSGTCNGTSNSTSTTPVPAVFEAISGVSVTNAMNMNFTDCTPASTSSTSTDYFDSNYTLLGTVVAGGDYSVFLIPPVIPAFVKVGDSGSIGTLSNFTDSSKNVSIGRDDYSYVVESDTANSAIVRITDKSFDSNNVLTLSQESRYRIGADGTLDIISADVQYWDGSTTHFALVVVPDTTQPMVLSTYPTDNSTEISVGTTIGLTFSELMDPASITTTDFIVRNGSNPVSGTVTYSATNATFTPTQPLSANTSYNVTVTTGVKDLAGNPIVVDLAHGNLSWSFTTKNDVLAAYVITPTASVPRAIAIGDVTGDGRNDLIMSTWFSNDVVNDYKVFVYPQNANGGLDSPIIYSTGSTYTCPIGSASIGDLNNDGKNDVLIGTICGIEVFTQNAQGGLNPSIALSSSDSLSMRIADLNNDGLQDVVSTGGINTISVWLQNSGGTLNAPVVYSVNTVSGSVDVGDLNGDGLTDIVFTTADYPNSSIGVLIQTPGGNFDVPVYHSVSAGWNIGGLAVGDVNGDGLSDVVVSYGGNLPSSSIGILYQNLSGALNPIVSTASYDMPGQIQLSDVTGDGLNDILVFHNSSLRLGVYQQLSNGTLQNEQLYVVPTAYSSGFSVGDINSDGNNDVVIADYMNRSLVTLHHF